MTMGNKQRVRGKGADDGLEKLLKRALEMRGCKCPEGMKTL